MVDRTVYHKERCLSKNVSPLKGRNWTRFDMPVKYRVTLSLKVLSTVRRVF